MTDELPNESTPEGAAPDPTPEPAPDPAPEATSEAAPDPEAAAEPAAELGAEARSEPDAGAEGDAAAGAEAEDALEAARKALAAATAEVTGDPGEGAAPTPGGSDPGADGVAPFEAPAFESPVSASSISDIDVLGDVDLDVTIELGRTRMLVEDVLKLGEGAVVELDKLAGDPVDVYVNDRHVARGEVLVLNDQFCVRVSEIIDSVPERPAPGSAS